MNRYHIPISMVASRSKVRYNHSGIKIKGQIDTISVGYCIINRTKVCLLSVEKLQLKTHLIQLNVGKALTWKLLQQLQLKTHLIQLNVGKALTWKLLQQLQLKTHLIQLNVGKALTCKLLQQLQLKTHLIQLNVGKALTWKLLQQLRLINKIYVSRKWYVHTHRLPSESPGYEVAYVASYSGWGGARVQPTLQVARFLISRCMSPIPKHRHIW